MKTCFLYMRALVLILCLLVTSMVTLASSPPKIEPPTQVSEWVVPVQELQTVQVIDLTATTDYYVTASEQPTYLDMQVTPTPRYNLKTPVRYLDRRSWRYGSYSSYNLYNSEKTEKIYRLTGYSMGARC